MTRETLLSVRTGQEAAFDAALTQTRPPIDEPFPTVEHLATVAEPGVA